VTAKLDAITLEVMWTRIISVVDEAAKAIVRTSFSTLSNEANDFACMLTDARGYALAQNSGSIPSFIGTLPATVRHFLREMGAERMQPGDVLITNDAWMGTGHMSDVSVLKPIFHRDKLVAFSATTSHMPDIGGRIRAIEAREIFEEGLHIPLTKLVHAGRQDDTLIQMIRANVRTPDQTMGDIWAQASANELIERRVTALMDDYSQTGSGAGRRALRPLRGRDARRHPRGARRHLSLRVHHRRHRRAVRVQDRPDGRRRRDRRRLHRHLAPAAAGDQLRDGLHVRDDRLRRALRAPARPGQ
jgi:N-methylhydantoinase B